jgi:LysM domain
MRRIIAVVPLFLGLGGAAWAQDEAAPVEAEAVAPATETESEPLVAPPGDQLMLQENIPARYVVVKGDTLWGISSRFLKNPWKWPDLWGVNKDVVRNPHWIYPGDVLILDLTGATPRLRLEGAPDGGLSRWYGYELQVSNLTPQMRSQPIAFAIPTISAKAIDPFLIRPLIVNPSQVAAAPKIVANVDKRVVVSAGDTAYVMGLDQKKGQRWQVYRKGRVFQDPDTKEVLGFEAVYLGDANVTGFGEISTVQVVSAVQEISLGDRLTVAPPLQSAPYVPRAPNRPVSGRIVAGSDETVSEMGTYSIVILNRGARDGLEVGNVLGLYRSEGTITLSADEVLPLPEQRYGLMMVFRVFERMAYALILTSNRPANVRDSFRNP